MSFSSWSKRFWKQIRGKNPFLGGDCIPTRVRFFGWGRPSLPFPHFWNYKTPIKILEAYFYQVDSYVGSGKHNRYFDIPGLDHVLVTREPEVISAILSDTGDKPGQFDRDTAPTAGIARATGEDSLLYANGAVWRHQKKMAAPPFSRSTLFQPEQFHEFEKTFRKTVNERMDALRERQKKSGEKEIQIELEPEIKAVMLEMLVNNFFGAHVSYEELRNRYVPSIMYLIDYMVTDTVGHRLRNFLKVALPKDKKAKEAKKDFDELTDIALQGRKEGLGLWSQFKSDSPDEKLKTNIRVFLAGALEATTSFAGWAISHLSRRPDLQDQIFDEVKDIDVYDPENLDQAKTLNRALEETLRLTPALYFLPRKATVDTWVETASGKKLFIPKNTHVVLDVWHSNRCDEFWGEEVCDFPAIQFEPKRWEILVKQGKTPKEILHFGFGHGPRVCPGKFLGMLEVGLVVGAFIKVFSFSAVADSTPVRAGVSTKPADGVTVRLKLREEYQS